MRLIRRSKPFDSDDWLFELKHDGFRALAFVEDGQCRLVSRNGHTFTKFAYLCANIAQTIRAESAVLDGEIVCLDATGRSVFSDLMFRLAGDSYFYAFDLLYLRQESLLDRPLSERRLRLEQTLKQTDAVQLSEQFTIPLERMVAAVKENRLEGIVAKRLSAFYEPG